MNITVPTVSQQQLLKIINLPNKNILQNPEKIYFSRFFYKKMD